MSTPSTRIRKAVFPVAGLGTRFLPATKAQPKEMLPVVDKPLIQYAVEEAYAAGIRDMIFVTGRNKRAIEDHFDTAYELESQLEASGKTELLNIARSVMPDDMTCSYVRQPRMLGLGHAVLCAEHLVGDEPFAVLLADDLMVGPTGGEPVLAQMTAVFAAPAAARCWRCRKCRWNTSSATASWPATPSRTAWCKVSKMVEKPKPEDAPSRLGVAGRYILTPGVFDEIRNQPHGRRRRDPADRRHRRADAEGIGVRVPYKGKRYDCGSKQGFLQAIGGTGAGAPRSGRGFPRVPQEPEAVVAFAPTRRHEEGPHPRPFSFVRGFSGASARG